ncbi:MAG TPA: redoxin domain-containing protein [Parvularculaceae bacterium]|nr:redoxin domain-containing protein [Parvularculaceae bacterium]
MADARFHRLQRAAPMIAFCVLAAAVVIVAIKLAPARGVVVETSPAPTKNADASPEFARAFETGIAAFRRGDAHAAAMAFKKASEINPEAADARANLGFALIELGSLDAARANFEAALTLNPQQFNAYYGIAEALEAQGDIEQAAGAMNTFLYYATPDDPFRRKAEAALWEWGRSPELDDGDNAEKPARAARKVYDLAARGLEGDDVSFAQYKGKVLVLNLWASWCPPCRRELPALSRLSARLDPKRFAVVGLSVDSNPDLVREYLSRIGVDFSNLWDKDSAVARGYFGVDAYPTTFIVGADGKVERRLVGYRDWASDGLASDIEATYKAARK